jgi:hypothetical protein
MNKTLSTGDNVYVSTRFDRVLADHRRDLMRVQLVVVVVVVTGLVRSDSSG